MYPPSHVPLGMITGFGRPNPDGSFAVPQDRVFEMERIHGWRKEGDTTPLTQDAFDRQAEEHRREIGAKDGEIQKLQAENQAIMSTNAELNRQIKDLAARLHAPKAAPKAPDAPSAKKSFKQEA